MLRYYLAVIFGGPLLIGAVNSLINSEEILFSVFASYLITATAFGIDALCAFAVRYLAKGAIINPFASFYNEKKWEKKLYKTLRVKAWKDKIPEMGGALAGFQKKKAESTSDADYLYKFMVETCYAEAMHILSVVLGFLVMLIMPQRCALLVGLPVALVNAILNILPVIVQRYVRPMLKASYRRACRHAAKK